MKKFINSISKKIRSVKNTVARAVNNDIAKAVNAHTQLSLDHNGCSLLTTRFATAYLSRLVDNDKQQVGEVDNQTYRQRDQSVGD